MEQQLGLKFVNYDIVFQEVPNNTTLAINISNCPCHCEGCHSSYLAENIGDVLTLERLSKLIDENDGITCVSFMGGDVNPTYVDMLSIYVHNKYPHLKTCWYSGRTPEHFDILNFDYIKTGPYIKELGPLTSRTTNQRFYVKKDGVYVEDMSWFWK